jgi:NitT/TauT family transport system substrate-binding protein
MIGTCMARAAAWIVAGMVLGAVPAGAQGIQGAQGAGPRPVKFITSLPTLTAAVPFTMLAKKLDRAHGIAVEMLQAGGSSPLMIDAVLSGNAEFASPGTGTALQAIRQGAELRIVAAISNNQLTAVIGNEALKRVGVSPTAPIAERMRALKGLTIGTNPVGATYSLLLRTYLKQYGVDPDKDVRLVGIADSGALISGIEQGRFDAIASASGVVEQAIAMKAGTLWFSGARGDIPGAESSMVSVVVARADTIEKHPEDVEALLAAMTEALDAIRNDHAETGRLLKAAYFTGLGPQLWDLVWNGATAAYPATLAFTRRSFDYWIANDPKGAESYRNVDYRTITYGPAQAP